MVEDSFLPRLGRYVFALGTAATGVLDIVWGEFEPAHQPIQAWGSIPGQRILAYIAGMWLIAAGLALFWRRSARAGALAAALLYGLFAAFWVPRLYTVPRLLGLRLGPLCALFTGIGQQLILVAGAALVYAGATVRDRLVRTGPLPVWTFGLSSIAFGLAHLANIGAVAPMVPGWLPPGGVFWTVLTGVAFVLAGVAMLAGKLDVLAARLLALMLLVFSALVLLPPLLAGMHSHVAWGSNAYNLAAVGAAWILAETLSRVRGQPERAGGIASPIHAAPLDSRPHTPG